MGHDANQLVMPGLDPGIHASETTAALQGRDVGARGSSPWAESPRDQPGHDDEVITCLCLRISAGCTAPGPGDWTSRPSLHTPASREHRCCGARRRTRRFRVSCILSYQADPHTAAGRLQTVLVEYEPPPAPINIVHLEGRHGRYHRRQADPRQRRQQASAGLAFGAGTQAAIASRCPQAA
jgi:hypothetical protein